MTHESWVFVSASVERGITIVIGPAAIVLACVAGIVFVAVARALRGALGAPWEAEEATLSLGQVGHVKIRPNREALQIAHRARIELVTRKAALPFDEEHDVISEVYDSWYQLFREMRALARECPAQQYRNDENVRDLVDVIVLSMNRGLRPHLTKWQARFRAWYTQELQSSAGEAPQVIQRRFPDYGELVADLKQVNTALVEYAEFLERLVGGKRGRRHHAS